MKPLCLPLTFTEAISGIKVTGPTDVLLAGNSSANLSCQATGGDVTNPAVWLKDGKPLSTSPRLVFAEDMHSFMIKTLQKDDNGEYTCQLSNPVSKEEASYKMEVICECLFCCGAVRVYEALIKIEITFKGYVPKVCILRRELGSGHSQQKYWKQSKASLTQSTTFKISTQQKCQTHSLRGTNFTHFLMLLNQKSKPSFVSDHQTVLKP